jgi:O-antigen/teichoic acid export membrane protein
VPIGYATNIVLGRISPEALGIYGLLGIFVTFTTTLILFGGNNAFAKYLPEMGAKKRAAFLSSYALVIFAIAVLITIILYLYPQILSELFGQQFPQNFLNYFVIFVPILLLFFIFNYTLNGLLELKISVIIGQLMTFSNFLFFTFMYFFCHSFFSENLWLIIFGFSIALYSFLVLLQSLVLEKKLRGSQSHTTESKRKATKRQDDAIKQKASISSFKLKMPKASSPKFFFRLGSGVLSFLPTIRRSYFLS